VAVSATLVVLASLVLSGTVKVKLSIICHRGLPAERKQAGCSFLRLRRLTSATPDLRLPSQSSGNNGNYSVPPFDRYQLMLLGERGVRPVQKFDDF